ncbi:MAG: Rha family transcriptional regulator [Rickettsiales bacterium]|jgi:Rha family phage regulatory protein|nr:Rha family transcriptional regulator [Rickettsiales bacterium]
MQNLNNLVELVDNKPLTTSLRVAEVFGKRHDNIVRDIKKLECSEKFKLLNFEETERTVEIQAFNGLHTKKEPMYTITRDGFTFLAMGFTGKKAAQFKEAYINAFNQMEQTLKGQALTNTDETALSDKSSGADNSLLEDKLNKKPSVLVPQTDTDGFYTFSTYIFKLSYT